MFIEPDEHLIVMEDDRVPHNNADLDMLKAAGIRTLMVCRAIGRSKITVPKAWGKFKLLLPFCYAGMSFTELVQRQDEMALWAKECSDLGKDIQAMYAMPEGGEFPWDSLLTKNFPLTDGQIIDFVIRFQHIFYKQHGEIWLSYHNFMGGPHNWNGVGLPKLYDALRKEFPNAPFYSLQYVHFSVGGARTAPECQELITKYSKEFGIRFFVGPDYCEGLKSENFDIALEQGAWGFVCSPTHGENPKKHQHIQPWMVETLLEADMKLKEYFSGNHKI